jgi:hypothetical protein
VKKFTGFLAISQRPQAIRAALMSEDIMSETVSKLGGV